MKVTLAKYGGFAAGIRRAPQSVDSTDLPESAAEELTRLVEAVKAVPAVERTGPGRARDAMSYTITVEEHNQHTVLRQSDPILSSPFAALLEWFERHSPVK